MQIWSLSLPKSNDIIDCVPYYWLCGRPNPGNCGGTLFGNGVITDVIKLGRMKSIWPCWCKESNWTQIHKKETVKQEEDDHVKIEAKTEVTPQTKEYLGSPETGQGKKGPSPRGFGGSRALPAPWLWISILKNCKTVHFCGFRPLSLWCFVMPTLGNWHTDK